MEVLAQILKVVVPGLVVAIATSFITVHLSLRRFHAEKWWEKKEAAYSSLIDVIHGLKEYASRHQGRELGVENPSEEEKQQLEKKWKEWNAEYGRLRDLAAFHVSTETVNILHRYDEQKTLAQNEDLFEWIEGDLKAAKICLEALIQEAKRDLSAK